MNAEQRHKAVQFFLDKDFPNGLAIAFAVIKILLALTVVGFQALAVYYKATYYQIYTGYVIIFYNGNSKYGHNFFQIS